MNPQPQSSRKLIKALAATVGLLVVFACGGGGSGVGSTNGGTTSNADVAGNWSGALSREETLRADFQTDQNGNITGTALINDQGEPQKGTLTGTVRGALASFVITTPKQVLTVTDAAVGTKGGTQVLQGSFSSVTRGRGQSRQTSGDLRLAQQEESSETIFFHCNLRVDDQVFVIDQVQNPFCFQFDSLIFSAGTEDDPSLGVQVGVMISDSILSSGSGDYDLRLTEENNLELASENFGFVSFQSGSDDGLFWTTVNNNNSDFSQWTTQGPGSGIVHVDSVEDFGDFARIRGNYSFDAWHIEALPSPTVSTVHADGDFSVIVIY